MIDEPPVVNGRQVQLTGDGSSDPDGTVASYAWTFGDGNTSTEANPTHTYGADDTYTVELTVTDDQGLASDTVTTEVTVEDVQPNEAPVAVIGEPPVVDGRQVQLTGDGSSDPDGTVASYAWTFDDGNTSTEANPTHTYGADGTYTVELTVTDNQGLASDPVTTRSPSKTCNPMRRRSR